MECIIALGQKFDALNKAEQWRKQVPYQPLIRFTADGTNGSYPEPNLGSICTNSSHKRVSLLILRHPTNYDGDTSFTLERYIWSALSLLFTGSTVNISSLVFMSLLYSKSNVFIETQNTTVNQVPRTLPSSFVGILFIISVSIT